MYTTIPDTVNIAVPDSVQKDTVIREFYLGKNIPVDTAGKSFPDTITSTDGSLARVYTQFSRETGILKNENPFNNDYAFGLLSLSLLMLAVISLTGRKQVVSIISSLSIKKPFVLKQQGGVGVFSWTPFFVNLFSIVNTSLFVVAGAVTMDMLGPLPGLESIKFVSLAFAGLTVAFLLRHLTCVVTGSVSGEKEAFKEYSTVITASWFISGFIFFCISCLILFTPIEHPEMLIMGGGGIFALLYFYRIIRLLIIFIRRSVTILYFILYLCALEILPVLILLKIAGVF